MSTLNIYSVLSDLQQARSISSLEDLIYQNLKHQMEAQYAKITFEDNDPRLQKYSNRKSIQLLKLPLGLDYFPEAKLCIAREKKFSKLDIKFLDKVVSTSHINLDRLIKIEQTQNLKQQWDSTFDAISTPLCLTNEKFSILRTNKSFTDNLSSKPVSIIGENAFSLFLGSQEISFKIEKNQKHFTAFATKNINNQSLNYEIHCQLISQPQQSNSLKNKQYLVMFRDITEQKKMEKQIFESAKMAELGTIGSSIAHELNNPLAGMLSFIQIIKMDLDKESPYYSDIKEMETATLKCKDIVENLLGFSRKHNLEEQEKINLTDVVSQSIKINELQTKTKGIQLDFIEDLNEKYFTLGNRNLLTQALGHLIQEASLSLQENMETHPGFRGVINIVLSSSESGPVITINDNRETTESYDPFQSGKSLGVTVAYKIMKDHQAIMELISQPKIGVQAKLSFKRPDLFGKRQVFDGEI